MIGNPRYGIVGLLALPYYVLFEALGPVIEISGYVVTVGALYFGLINWRYAELMFLLSVVYGTLISLAAVVLEEISYRRYQRVRDLLLLIGLGILENFGFRQLTTWWRIKGTYDFLGGQGRLGRDDAQGVLDEVGRAPRHGGASRAQPWRDFFGFDGRLSSTPAPSASRRSS